MFLAPASGLRVQGFQIWGKAPRKRNFKLPWRKAGPPNHHDDKVEQGSNDAPWDGAGACASEGEAEYVGGRGRSAETRVRVLARSPSPPRRGLKQKSF